MNPSPRPPRAEIDPAPPAFDLVFARARREASLRRRRRLASGPLLALATGVLFFTLILLAGSRMRQARVVSEARYPDAISPAPGNAPPIYATDPQIALALLTVERGILRGTVAGGPDDPFLLRCERLRDRIRRAARSTGNDPFLEDAAIGSHTKGDPS